ncbi:MAG: 30S ribosomal protein S16 [Chloroflexota bacterium]
MIRIRLSRVGAKRQPSYRVVVTNIEARRDGRFIERIGHYNPRSNPVSIEIEEDRALYWLSVGAQPSDAVKRLLEKQGTYDRLAHLRSGAAEPAPVAEPPAMPAAEEPAPAVAPEVEMVAEVEETAEPGMVEITAPAMME